MSSNTAEIAIEAPLTSNPLDVIPDVIPFDVPYGLPIITGDSESSRRPHGRRPRPNLLVGVKRVHDFLELLNHFRVHDVDRCGLSIMTRQ
jgi:hypothetical protein